MITKNKIISTLLVTSLIGLSTYSYVSATNTGTTNTSTGTQINREVSLKGFFGKGDRGFKNQGENLTDAERTALESMSESQKHAFFEKKRLENETKIEARESVIDKKLSDQTLNETEKKLLAEIIKERADMKAKRTEMKALFEAIKPILDKKKAGTTLSTQEQAKLDAFEIKYPHPEKEGKHGKKGKKKGFGDHF